MPLVPPALAGAITASLISSGMLGTATPKFASGVAMGVTIWAHKLQVNTIDVGTAGVGVGLMQFLMPAPVLISAMIAAYAGNGQLGVMAPLEATGLATGISLGLAQGTIITTHPSVGVGAGVARINGPPAVDSIMQGFSSVGITGSGASAKANAISIALMVALQTLVLPIPIVGAGSIIPSSGSGSGSIL